MYDAQLLLLDTGQMNPNPPLAIGIECYGASATKRAAEGFKRKLRYAKNPFSGAHRSRDTCARIEAL